MHCCCCALFSWRFRRDVSSLWSGKESKNFWEACFHECFYSWHQGNFAVLNCESFSTGDRYQLTEIDTFFYQKSKHSIWCFTILYIIIWVVWLFTMFFFWAGFLFKRSQVCGSVWSKATNYFKLWRYCVCHLINLALHVLLMRYVCVFPQIITSFVHMLVMIGF